MPFGYWQALCPYGHYQEAGYFDKETYWECSFCQSEVVWTNFVDQTNEGDVGFVELVLIDSGDTCKCSRCGLVHQSTPDRYRVPQRKSRSISGEIEVVGKLPKESAKERRQRRVTKEMPIVRRKKNG